MWVSIRKLVIMEVGRNSWEGTWRVMKTFVGYICYVHLVKKKKIIAFKVCMFFCTYVRLHF